MAQRLLASCLILGVLCTFGCSAGKGAGSTPSLGAGAGPSGANGAANGAAAGAGTALSGGAGTANISVGSAMDMGTGGDGSPTAQQCDGKFVGYLRDFTIADPNDMVQNPTSNPQIAETVNGVAYAVSPDFEVRLHDMSKVYDDDHGIVTTTLGADSEPVYAGPAGGTPTTTGPANFQTWFHDAPGVNLGQKLTLQFDKDPTRPSDPNAYTFASGPDGTSCLGPDKAYCYGFYPIDGMLLGNEGNNHNYHMTFELHLKFKYHAGQTFHFKGDDDVWVYVNGSLAVDLGGLHRDQEEAVLDLDTRQLTEGGVYPLDFFWCERHITASNFRIDTSLEVVDCGVVR
jgi:fibro-slime domain-containing protein